MIFKKMLNNKKLLIGVISGITLFIVICVSIALLISNSDEKEKSNILYSYSELKFLEQVNTNEFIDALDSGVNSELIGTYAILTKHNELEDTYDIIALKKDNTTVKIATTEYSSWENGIYNLFYSNGKIYYEYADDTIWSIDLTEGNGIYNLKEYDFLEGYIFEYPWFYVIDNKIYYFNTGALRICDLMTEECNAQVIDLQQSISKFEIDGETINFELDNVYIENNKYIYVLSEYEENIYKIDINNPKTEQYLTLASYTKVNEVGKNAKLVSELNKLTSKNIKINYGYNYELSVQEYFIEYQNKRYDLKDYNLQPITLLPDNYLMVKYFDIEQLGLGQIKYINLKTGLIDENYSLQFEEYYDNDSVYFITK